MKLLDALFCDDVRFEANGKLSLMGLYNDKIVYPKAVELPVLPLAILLRFIFDERDGIPHNFEFEYFLNKNVLVNIKGQIQTVSSHRFANLVINATGLKLEPGELGFAITIYNEKNEQLFNKKNTNAIKITTE